LVTILLDCLNIAKEIELIIEMANFRPLLFSNLSSLNCL